MKNYALRYISAVLTENISNSFIFQQGHGRISSVRNRRVGLKTNVTFYDLIELLA